MKKIIILVMLVVMSVSISAIDKGLDTSIEFGKKNIQKQDASEFEDFYIIPSIGINVGILNISYSVDATFDIVDSGSSLLSEVELIGSISLDMKYISIGYGYITDPMNNTVSDKIYVKLQKRF